MWFHFPLPLAVHVYVHLTTFFTEWSMVLTFCQCDRNKSDFVVLFHILLVTSAVLAV